MSTDSQAQLRLLHFLSPALPVGAYSYSQGLEWAVEQGWVVDEASFRRWTEEQITSGLREQELPLLARLYRSVKEENVAAFENWSQFAVAVRDTAELRQEERDRAEAYFRVLSTLCDVPETWSKSCFLKTPFASMAWFAVEHAISEDALLLAYAHNWLETSVVTGIKIIPLGQSAGQKLIFDLSDALISSIDHSKLLSDDSIGITMPAFSMASCGHEVQYSRVYRS